MNVTASRCRLLALLLLLLSGCCVLFPVRRDAVTLWELNDLKEKVRVLYESFTRPNVDAAAVAHIDDQWKALAVREEAKGNCNALMISQIQRCRDMFAAHLRDRNDSAPWSPAHHDNLIENISDAIDLARRTELSKDP